MVSWRKHGVVTRVTVRSRRGHSEVTERSLRGHGRVIPRSQPGSHRGRCLRLIVRSLTCVHGAIRDVTERAAGGRRPLLQMLPQSQPPAAAAGCQASVQSAAAGYTAVHGSVSRVGSSPCSSVLVRVSPCRAPVSAAPVAGPNQYSRPAPLGRRPAGETGGGAPAPPISPGGGGGGSRAPVEHRETPRGRGGGGGVVRGEGN